jgi:mannose-6-phosphate isomerase
MENVVISDKVEKPWGWYTVHDTNNIKPYKIKTLYIKPHLQFSLQKHEHREEFWVIVDGDGFLTLSDHHSHVVRGNHIHIGTSVIHRLTAGKDGIKLVEVQLGTICDEDDIVRLKDDYGRI